MKQAEAIGTISRAKTVLQEFCKMRMNQGVTSFEAEELLERRLNNLLTLVNKLTQAEIDAAISRPEAVKTIYKKPTFF